MKKIKKLFYMLALLLLIGGASLGLSEKTVEASPGVIALRNNRVYRTYDLDGNRRKDSIMLKTTGKRYNLSASFYVNGKKVYSLPKKDCYSAGYRMITLKNGKHFIYAWTEGANPLVSSHRLLQYSKGKMKTVCILGNFIRDYQSGCYLEWYENPAITVSGNSIRVKLHSMNWTTGGITFVINMSYKNGTLVRSGYSGNLTRSESCRVSKDFYTYKSPGSRSKAFKVRKGENVVIKKYYVKQEKLYFQVRRANGQTGWIKAFTRKQSGPGRSPIFSNRFYAS